MSHRSTIAAARAARRPRKAKPRDRKSTGVPPPPTFDLSSLAADQLLVGDEVAAVLRKSTATIAGWRQDPSHPLKWERVPPTDDGRPMYRVRFLRSYIAGRGDDG